MTEAAKKYAALLTELLLARSSAGGVLPEEEESFYVERLDRLWWALTEKERDAAEIALAGPPIGASKGTAQHPPDKRRFVQQQSPVMGGGSGGSPKPFVRVTEGPSSEFAYGAGGADGAPAWTRVA